MSNFMEYAVVAAHEALEDAGWKPETEEEQEMAVRFGVLKNAKNSQLTPHSGNLSRLRYR